MRNRTFNRLTTDGLTHVVNFQMGSFDPPGTTYIPGFSENLYGKFTVNVGVYVPEVAQYHGGGEPKHFVQEYHCCVRARLSSLRQEPKESWWKIRDDRQTADEVRERLELDAFPFLARFESRDGLLNELLQAPDLGSIGGPPRIVSAIILTARGEPGKARALLAAQVRNAGNLSHAEYVRTLARKLGLGTLNV
jgi:Domain of unknown function (DUF4304)